MVPKPYQVKLIAHITQQVSYIVVLFSPCFIKVLKSVFSVKVLSVEDLAFYSSPIPEALGMVPCTN